MITNHFFHSLEEFNIHCNNLNNDLLNIISINIRSISSILKFNKFRTLIAKFSKLPAVIAVQETWFKQNIVQIYSIPGYKAVHCCRSDHFGGTSVFVHESIRCSVERISNQNFIDSVVLKFCDLKLDGKEIIFISFYKSQKCVIHDFLMFIEDLLSRYGRYHCILVGDANIDLLNKNMSQELINLLKSFDFRNCHDLITRQISGTSIDHVYTNMNRSINVDSINCMISDHNMISCRVDIRVKRHDYKVENIVNCDYAKLERILQDKMENFTYTGESSTDTSNLISSIRSAVESSTVVTCRRTNNKDKIAPWINGNLQKLIIIKSSLLKQRRKRRNNILEASLKRISKVIKAALRISMNNFYVGNLENLNNDPKKTWRFINENLGRVEQREFSIADRNGKFIENNFRKAEIFNSHFLQSVNLIKQQIVQSPSDCCNGLRTLRSFHNRFRLNYTSNEEVKDIISSLLPGKSCGHDNIYPRVFLHCSNCISPNIVRIFNTIVDSSVYPDILKIHKVIPIPKESKATTVEQYRPISILPIIDQIFERILHKQIFSYFMENNLLNEFQYGFRKGCGTEEAIVNVQNYICKGLDEGHSAVAGIFYDLTKAFDLIDHEILLQKLKYYGIHGNEILLLESYLTNRRQFVQVKEERSNLRNVVYGVPQGSVLGPLLFSIYINDLKNLNLTGKIFIFADDISIFYHYKHETALKPYMERDASLVSEYIRINKLFLNPAKTKLIRFKPHFGFSNNFSIFVEGKEVRDISSVEYLGICFQGNLMWDQHIRNLKVKLSPALGLIYKFKNKFDKKTKFLIYQALVQSHCNYLAVIYGFKKTTEFKSLQRMQNKALKSVANLPSWFPTVSLYRDVFPTVLPIYGLYKFQLLLYMFKCLNCIGHHTIQFTRNQDTFHTRNRDNLRISFCQSETTKQRVEHSGCREYNNLPHNIKQASSLSQFKNNLKKFLSQHVDELLI